MNWICMLLLTTSLSGSMMTTINQYRNESVKELRTTLDQWAIDAYREYPYLYVYQDETDYNTIFEVDPKALVLIAEREGEKIGMISASPLNSQYLKDQAYTPSQYLDQIAAQGFDPKSIYYISCFLMQKEDRQNKKVAQDLFDQTVSFAKSLGYSQVAYMEITTDPTDALRPIHYLPCEPWALLNKPFRSMNVTVVTSWPTLQPDGSVAQKSHALPLYVIDI